MTLDQWSRAYASHGVHKPHHFIGSISEIIKKLPEGLQISRVSQEINGTLVYTFACGLLMAQIRRLTVLCCRIVSYSML